MNPEQFKKIISAWIDGTLGNEDKQLLNGLLMQPQYQDLLHSIMQEQQLQGYAMQPGYEAAHQRMREALQNKTKVQPQTKLRQLRFWLSAAAAVLIVTGAAFFFLTDKKQAPAPAQEIVAGTDIKPATEGAILTLADGSTIVLDSLGNGTVINQKGTEATLANGQLVYNKTGAATGAVTYNALSTPRGRQFRIVLPDGTVAWLNAASSIRYPTKFSADRREVEIGGEVYFEVAAKQRDGKKLPFIVNADKKFTVEVLGTHFNVNAYKNEPVLNTTLLEGKVQVTATGTTHTVLLEPGQQAALQWKAGSQPSLQVQKADIEKVMAWKNGVFNFENARLDEVMRQMERWYDIDVKYESVIPNIEFVGKMTRDIPLSGLLIALEKSNVRFRLEGRTLVVKP